MRSFAFRITSMASNAAHHATGWAAGLIATTLVTQASHASLEHPGSILALCATVAGSTAPNWMEVAWWTRARRLWITHRTATHWGIGWLAALVLSYQALGHVHLWTPLLFGFTYGGLMHLLADWSNPLGVPWIWGRHSLNLWKSGRCDLIMMILAWAAACQLARPLWAATTTCVARWSAHIAR